MSEQMYLKCVKGDSTSSPSYIAGNTYKVLDFTFDDEKLYVIRSELGNALSVPLKGLFWEFEIVEESPESPKLTPRSLGCFQEVADVIGEANAVVELQKVIDCKDTVWDKSDQSLIECFSWASSPQDDDFWFEIRNGKVPEELQTKAEPKSTPEFGDVLHINGVRCLFIRVDEDGDYEAVDDSGVTTYVDLHEFDEYKPNKSQELRNRILERWQRKSLENSYDTELCRPELSVGDLVDFVVENIESEAGE